MSGGRSLNFEVYYLQYGRWQIHHRYGMQEREAAIEEAKRLDSQFEASCVVRESFNAASGASSESVIYHSPKLKTKPPVSFITAGQGGAAAPARASGAGRPGPLADAPKGSAAANAAAEARRKASEKGGGKATKDEPALRRPPKMGERAGGEEADWTGALPKLLIAFLLACIVGTAAGIGAYYLLKASFMIGLSFSREMNQLLLVAAWFLGWAAAFVPMLRRILASIRPPPAPSNALTPTAIEPAAVSGVPDAPAPAVSAAAAAATARAEGPAPAEAGELPAGTAPADAEPSARPEPAPSPDSVAVNNEETGPEPLRTGLSKIAEEAKRLTGGRLESDHFLRFGVILYLAGAAESLAWRCKVAAKEVTGLLSEQIEALGVAPKMAIGFAANINEYLLDTRYFEMYAAGRGAALDQETGAAAKLGAALDAWRTPKPAPGQAEAGAAADDPKHFDGRPGEKESHAFVAVLFTDIVNSTQNQQTKGDAWLMNVVRAHNDIVREAISKRGGREIKHTGDGIMASFPAVASSVEAALAMQEGIKRFSEMMPDLGFEICVGISAGEPIHESGDLFGTPVNLAARVLSKAKAGETAVSSVVREMCRGKSFAFEEIGRFELKGFEEPQPIFRAVDRRRQARTDGAAPPSSAVAE
jgi:class 3 adenylate cyclase